eukprot:366421-Chlamydomonas_euryale.AAC.1
MCTTRLHTHRRALAAYLAPHPTLTPAPTPHPTTHTPHHAAHLRALHPSLHGIDHARKVVLSGECKQRACQISTRIQRTATAAAITVSSSVSAAGVRRLHTRPQPHLHSVLGQRAERAVVRSRILTNAEHTVMVLAQVPTCIAEQQPHTGQGVEGSSSLGRTFTEVPTSGVCSAKAYSVCSVAESEVWP